MCIVLPCRGTPVLAAPSEGWDEGSVGPPLGSPQLWPVPVTRGFPPQSHVLSLFRKVGNLDFKAVLVLIKKNPCACQTWPPSWSGVFA